MLGVDPTADTVALSVLDLAPVSEGSTPAEALAHSIDLVRHVEALGYRRQWVAEHHNMVGIASSSPAVLIAHLAQQTTTIRVGSGGVMLPNHAPMAIAEQFGMLEALHPGRIDLGLGRAPGTDGVTAAALRRGARPTGDDEFPEQLNQLLGFFGRGFDATHPYRSITAVPAKGYQPAMWMLGSSDYGAQVAAALGWPYSFAYHFAPEGTLDALDAYRRHFRPSPTLGAPYAMLGVSVLCADTDAQAEYLAGSGLLAFVRLRTGRPGQYPSPETAAAYPYQPAEERLVRYRMATQAVGSPATVRAALQRLVDATGVNELMVTTMAYDHRDRLRSYTLLAEELDAHPLRRPVGATAAPRSGAH
jgi:luciferase family oxidoreductase group 1